MGDAAILEPDNSQLRNCLDIIYKAATYEPNAAG